ncbi:hypothetical protein E2C01_009067 [Portunus trituberculatus]|uniref:Uncharacterized protein n=1 Tax=Portunus trituberculatus TaxID=210409 RepID=A0A5B7D2G6_PORTR|nr:hypothetical protein [Portunus trituberculatus]
MHPGTEEIKINNIAYHGALGVHLQVLLDELTRIRRHIFPRTRRGLTHHSDISMVDVLRVAVIEENQVPMECNGWDLCHNPHIKGPRDCCVLGVIVFVLGNDASADRDTGGTGLVVRQLPARYDPRKTSSLGVAVVADSDGFKRVNMRLKLQVARSID